MLDVSGIQFSSVIDLPDDVHVHDFATPEGRSIQSDCEYSIGKYNEDRRGMYETALFSDNRFIHVGIDIGAPIDTPIKSFADGTIYSFGVNPHDGDYGPTIITQHQFNGIEVWALYGHLASRSLSGLVSGEKICSGEIIAWVGKENENGGWPPHLHFQLSLEKPVGHDIPGVVSLEERVRALQVYPDPRIVLGDLY